MGNFVRITFTAAAISLATLTAAVAQGAGQGPVAQACASEIAKFCAGKDHGKGEVRTCLESNKANVSPACKTALDTTGGGGRKNQK